MRKPNEGDSRDAAPAQVGKKGEEGQALRELVAKWRRIAALPGVPEDYSARALKVCADELTAALAAAPAITDPAPKLREALEGIIRACDSHSGADKFVLKRIAQRALGQDE